MNRRFNFPPASHRALPAVPFRVRPLCGARWRGPGHQQDIRPGGGKRACEQVQSLTHWVTSKMITEHFYMGFESQYSR